MPPGEAPDDADDLRGYHFRRLLGQTSTWVIIGALMIVAGAAAGIYFKSAPLAGAAAGALLVLGLIGVFAIADSRAEDAFFVSYANSNGLALGGRTPLPPATPAAAQGRRPLRRAHPDRRTSATGSTASSPSTHMRRSTPTATATGRRTTTATRSAWSRSPSAPRSSPSSTCSASSACAPWRSSRTSSAAPKNGSSSRARPSTSATRSSSTRARTPNWVRQLFAPTFIVWLQQETPGQVRLRARRRHALLLHAQPQEEGRRPRPHARRDRPRRARGCARSRSSRSRAPPRRARSGS